jgi:hypothetical protein
VEEKEMSKHPIPVPVTEKDVLDFATGWLLTFGTRAIGAGEWNENDWYAQHPFYFTEIYTAAPSLWWVDSPVDVDGITLVQLSSVGVEFVRKGGSDET